MTPSTLKTDRKFLLGGGLAYFIWWFAVEWLLPGSYNPFLSRILVVGFFLLGYGGSFFSKKIASLSSGWMTSGLWFLTLHYFYLFYRNETDINWVVGSFITVIAACSCMQTLRSLLEYSGFVIVLSIVLMVLDQTLLHTIFLSGILTLLLFAYIGLSTRIRLIQNRFLYESSKESIRARDEFLSIASHELKTPLTNIKLQTQVALRTYKSKSAGEITPEQMKKTIQQIDRHTDRLVRLVEDMLDISKITSGKMQMNFETFDLVSLAREVVDTFNENQNHTSCVLQHTGSGSSVIRADPFRIEQVITNLLSNAVKYGEEKPIRLQIETRPHEVLLSVIDQGMGIAIEDQNRIFDRFERAVSSQKISGLGLGLYICRNIANAHGGSIQVQSNPGEGSKFTVTLPLG